MTQKSGVLISLEGGEGCGKSTQIKLLAAELSLRNIPITLTREPGGEIGAEAIRELLVSGDVNRWCATTETLLFLAARVQHVERVIKPALAKGHVVLCDRFHDSTLVYQGIGRGLSKEFYAMLHAATLGNFAPDLTLLLDVPVEVGLKRAIARGGKETRFEQMDMSFHHQVRKGFIALATAEPERIAIIDAHQPLEHVKASILEVVQDKFGF
jgi:dTMP kinase